MNIGEIAKLRLINQQIANPKFETAGDLVNWMGAMQAQDFMMAQWAIGLRLKKSTQKEIHEAIDSAEIIRTHLLRPTWHFVAGEDIYWMLNLSAAKIKAGMKGRHKELELNEKVLKKSNSIIEKALIQGNYLTRKELVIELNKGRIQTGNNRASHIFLNAELEGIICSGKMKSTQPTYALLNERVPNKKLLSKEESLFELANKYFQSHSPATFHDFLWWSGLSVADAKTAVESVRENYVVEKINGSEYFFTYSSVSSKILKKSVFLLPAFDEFLISYKDRSASRISEHELKAFSKNGIFWPTIVINGKVAGTWKREIKKEKTIITASFFDTTNKIPDSAIQKEAQKFGFFLNHKTGVLIADGYK